jgi:hypothetical protein
MTFDRALWILEHQIGPNCYGLKWHAVVTILEATKERRHLMDSWPTTREVEKVKPFAARAERCINELQQRREALVQLFGRQADDLHLSVWIKRACELLAEASRRGVKGKDDPRK